MNEPDKTQPASLVSGAGRVLELAIGVFTFAGSIAVFGLMCLTIVAVIWRYFLASPIFGIEDLSQLGLSVLAAAAVCYGTRSGAHVSIDIIHQVFPKRLTKWTDVVMNLLSFAISALAVYALVRGACGIEKACITTNLAIEHVPFYYVLAVSFGLISLHFLIEALDALRIAIAHPEGAH